ncbi:MAG: ArsR family transcriptional regulator [Deltaproteobacteria bacterium]|nr:ArsR family transcriptional regulator [Deltaproteobacteria bacterium]MBT8463562.1 ArsR family transcriptional regulator [Deltaproteobacteria bacterium]NND29292.1 ArsR family transcriptional regulator [Myxococcales bacterium]NNK08716.1 ArsR family transcriptional regulator [Myxococcales bacterium]NNK41820.1 ArsR family transcriptional regulator [Myxococcales bacterium]
MGRLMEFWGFRRHMGRLWTILYLSPEPLTTAELSETLRLSSSAVSLSLGELVRWGAVRKTWRPGERRDFYQAESNVWKLLRRVYERRELNLVREASDAFRDAQRFLDEARDQLTGPDRKRVDYMRKRVARLSALTRTGERLIGLLIAGRPFNPADLSSTEEEQ